MEPLPSMEKAYGMALQIEKQNEATLKENSAYSRLKIESLIKLRRPLRRKEPMWTRGTGSVNIVKGKVMTKKLVLS